MTVLSALRCLDTRSVVEHQHPGRHVHARRPTATHGTLHSAVSLGNAAIYRMFEYGNETARKCTVRSAPATTAFANRNLPAAVPGTYSDSAYPSDSRRCASHHRLTHRCAEEYSPGILSPRRHPLVHPTRGMPLLARHTQIRTQPFVRRTHIHSITEENESVPTPPAARTINSRCVPDHGCTRATKISGYLLWFNFCLSSCLIRC